MFNQKLSRSAWLIGLILLLAFGLRVYNLTYHSIWFDEAVSIRWAKTSIDEIISVSMRLEEDRLPPLYYLMLFGWMKGAGLSEFALRYLSVLWGTGLIAVVYRLGRAWFGHKTALLAALLSALNPFLIWYSQEARMYALAVFLGVFGVLSFWQGLRGSGWTAWLGLGVAALAGLYSHLYTGFLWPALAIWLLLNPAVLKRVWLQFGLTMTVVSVLFLPLAWANWQFSGESTPGNPLSGLGRRIYGLFDAFVIWQAPFEEFSRQSIVISLGILLLLGLAISLKSRNGWLLTSLLVSPFIIASILMLRSELAFFGQRYFIVMVPWVLLLQALALVSIGIFLQKKWGASGQGVAFGLLAISVLATAWPIAGQWRVPAAKEAWRQSYSYLKQQTGPNDAVFIHPEWVRFPYQYYEAQMGSAGQTYAAFFSVDENTDLDGRLTGVLGNHPVIWLVQSHIDEPDLHLLVEKWFASRFPLVTELYPPGLTIKAYAPGYQRDSLPAQATELDRVFETGLHLRGYELRQQHFSQQEPLLHPPSTWVPLILYWQADTKVLDTMPKVELTDSMGQIWGVSLERPTDSLKLYPPSQWETGQIVVQYLDVNLNPAIPPGEYGLNVVINDDWEPVGRVWIEE